MNIGNKLNAKIKTSLTLFFLACALSSQSQVKQAAIEGKNYLVYPLQLEIYTNARSFYSYFDQFEKVQRDEKNREIISVEVVDITFEDRGFQEKRKMTKRDKAAITYIEKNKLYLANYNFDYISKDPTPCLESLPDGEYVQYFRDLPFIDKGVIRYKNDVKAAFFTLKNNLLQGKVTFFDFQGDLIIGTGNYDKGLKSGNWEELNYAFVDQYLSYEDKEENPIKVLQSKSLYTFFDGMKTGPYENYSGNKLMEKGEFKENEPSGHWIKYQFKTYFDSVYLKKYKMYSKYVDYSDELIKRAEYTYRSDKSARKGILIRTEIVPEELIYGSPMADTLELYDQLSEAQEGSGFNDWSFFYLLKIDEENTDLPEEQLNSYEDEYSEEYYGEYGEEDEYMNRLDSTFVEGETYIYEKAKRYTLNDYIDSAGYIYLYDGIAEEFYSNGQLKYRFEVIDGVLQNETPVYWSNGQIANEILKNEVTKGFIQNFYDYNGVKYSTKNYTSKGNLIKEGEVRRAELITINGKDYVVNNDYPTYFWDINLEDSLTQPTVVSQEVFKLTKSEAVNVTFNPIDNSRKNTYKDLAGNIFKETSAQYTSDYFSLTEQEKISVGNFEILSTGSGPINPYTKLQYTDKNSQSLGFSSYAFDLTYDQELFVNKQAFNGAFSIKNNTKHLKFNANSKQITYHIPTDKGDLKDYNAAVKKFKRSGKQNDVTRFYVSDFNRGLTVSRTLLKELSFTYGQFDARTSPNYNFGVPEINLYEGYEDYEYEGSNNKRNKKYERKLQKTLNRTVASSLTLDFVNGRPNGSLIVKDPKKFELLTGEFINGQETGQFKSYSWMLPKPKLPKRKRNYSDEEYYYYEQELMSGIPDSLFPKKATHFLTYISDFKNGKREGYSRSFNWKGDTLSSAWFKDGLQEGAAFERNQYVYQESNFEFGAYDGIQRTYLLKPDKDSVLLYELNFQDGSLQGESKSYHANGLIAKKGFFLNGQPIDDYEAYDTLGFKYQYVKFQFNQPVEEKIWEESKLSVRYEFDWRDSIYFNVEDIISVSSIDRLAQLYGFSNNQYREPYYGRPSVLVKNGVNYTLTKYYPNDVIARTGHISKGKKVDCWNYFSYEGIKLMEVEYFDTLLKINDSTKFRSKGVVTLLDEKGKELSKSYIIEKFEKYDCAHTDHNEERLLYCFTDNDPKQNRINGYVKNYYDNGSIMNEGMVKNGLPNGIWKMYDADGNMSSLGEYVNGKRDGRWLEGDLGTVKNMSEICLNPNLDNLEEILKYQENLLDITVIYYKYGKQKLRTYYGINQNNGEAPDGYEGEGEYYPEMDYYEEGGY